MVRVFMCFGRAREQGGVVCAQLNRFIMKTRQGLGTDRTCCTSRALRPLEHRPTPTHTRPCRTRARTPVSSPPTHLGEAVPGQVHQVPVLIDYEVVDALGLACV